MEKDYDLMGKMFFEEPLGWSQIVKVISAFEKEFNSK